MSFCSQAALSFVFASLTSGCALGELGLTGEEWDSYMRSIKSYMQYWEKPGTSEDERLREWRMCGGMKNGSYASDEPSGSTTEVLLAGAARKRMQLDRCMTEKGYQRTTGVKSVGGN